MCVCVCVCVCVSYCRQYDWSHGCAVLVRPYDTTFMSYESVTAMSAGDTFQWLRRRLLEHIHVVSSLGELQRDWLESTASARHRQQVMRVIICVDDIASTPLFLAALSPLLDSRVRFAQVARSIAEQAVTLSAEHEQQQHQQLSVVISSDEMTYVYGSADADCMTLSAVRLVLTLLSPSAADLLDVAVSLSLLLLSVEPCLVFSGLKSRLVSVVLLSLRLSFLLLLYCFFVSYVMPEHELRELFDGLLPVWRSVMLSSFGNRVRSDWLRYSTVNFDGFVVSYLSYLLLVAWFYRRLCRHKIAWLSSFCNSLQDDDDDDDDWYTWQQFGVPYFWQQSLATASDETHGCALCELSLSYGCRVCRLACQHVFHHSCLASLIHSDQADSVQCPACLVDADDQFYSTLMTFWPTAQPPTLCCSISRAVLELSDFTQHIYLFHIIYLPFIVILYFIAAFRTTRQLLTCCTEFFWSGQLISWFAKLHFWCFLYIVLVYLNKSFNVPLKYEICLQLRFGKLCSTDCCLCNVWHSYRGAFNTGAIGAMHRGPLRRALVWEEQFLLVIWRNYNASVKNVQATTLWFSNVV